MQKETPSITKRPLFYWAFSGKLKLQLLLLFIIVIVVVARIVPLEMQKRIINDAVAQKQFDSLLIYCGIYLIAVVIASVLKFAINYLQTLIGQAAMAEMRKDLYHHILTLPLGFFRKTQPGMVVSSLITELNTAGNFAGMAIATPVINILTLIAFAVYLLLLNPLLASVTLCIYPIVIVLIPLLQKRANRANKERVDLSRQLSSQIAEAVSAVQEIQAHTAFEQENSRFDAIVERLRKIRIIWSAYRFGIKVTNNFFVSLGPFIVFVLGGYLVMNGRLELGSMVAFLSAQEKLYDPWKELIGFYQVYQDASVRYTRTMEYFDAKPEFAIEYTEHHLNTLKENIEIKDLSFETTDGHVLLNHVNLTIQPGEHLALVGFSGSGKSTLAQCVGKLYKYTSGSILLDGKELSSFSKKDVVKHIGYVNQKPFIFTGTIAENLLYAFWPTINTAGQMREIGTSESPSLDRMIETLQQVGLFVDVMHFGLNTVSRDMPNSLIEKILAVRAKLQKDFSANLSPYIEFYQEGAYLRYSNIIDNLIFGASDNKEFLAAKLPNNKHFIAFLDSIELTNPLLRLGVELGTQSVDILANLDPDEIFFEQSPITAKTIGDFKRIVEKLKNIPVDSLPSTERHMLLELALNFVLMVHKITVLPSSLEKQILAGRSSFVEWSTKVISDSFSFYQPDKYIFGKSILNNIIFGQVKAEVLQAPEIINQTILQLLIEEDCLESIAQIGMDFHVGREGDRLSGGQQQKLAIARVLIKKPKLIIMDEATSALDNKSQSRVQNLIKQSLKECTVLAVVHRLDIVKSFDSVAVMKDGRVVETGPHNELITKKGFFYELKVTRK